MFKKFLIKKSIDSFIKSTFHLYNSNRHSIGNLSLISEFLEMGLIDLPYLIQNIKNFFYLYNNYAQTQSYVFIFFTKEIKSYDLSLYKNMREMFVSIKDPKSRFQSIHDNTYYQIINEYKSLSEVEADKFMHIKDMRPITPLCQAIINDDFDSFSEIAYSSAVQVDINSKLSYEFNVNSEFLDSHPTLIQFAAGCSSLKIFKHLILSGADIGSTNKFTNGINSYAVAGGNLEIVRILYQNGVNYKGYPLKFAVKYQRNDIVDWILNIVSKKPKYDDAILYAIQYENLCVLNNYLGSISDHPGITHTSFDHTLIPETIYIFYEDHYDVIKNIFTKTNPFFELCLPNLCIEKNKCDQFEYLMKTKEVDIDWTMAFLIDNMQCFKKAYEYGLFDLKTFIYGCNPLPFALVKDPITFDTLKYVLDIWPECINLEDESHSNSLLSIAAEECVTQVVLELVKRGADISYQCKNNGKQPIHLAAKSISCIEILVAAGADINTVNEKKGYTPIFYAIEKGISFMDFKKFVDLGAKIDVCDNTGKSLLELALQKELLSIFFYIFENSDLKERILPHLINMHNYEIFRYLIDQACDYSFLNDKFSSDAEIILENMLKRKNIDIQLIALFLSAYGSSIDPKSLIFSQLFMEKLIENGYHYFPIELLTNSN